MSRLILLCQILFAKLINDFLGIQATLNVCDDLLQCKMYYTCINKERTDTLTALTDLSIYFRLFCIHALHLQIIKSYVLLIWNISGNGVMLPQAQPLILKFY